MPDDEERDPFGPPYVEVRDDIVPGRVYRGADIKKVIRKLSEGDVVEVKTEGESYPDRTLTVTEYRLEESVVVDDKDNELRLLSSHMEGSFRFDGDPWLRSVPENESRGRVTEITLSEFGDSG